MENELITLLRQEIPTGYQKQLFFYKKYLEVLVENPLDKEAVNKLIGTLVLMCHDQTGEDLKSVYNEVGVVLEEEETIEQEINELVYGLNKITNLNQYREEQQSKRILFNYLLLLSIVKMQKQIFLKIRSD